MTLEYTGSDSNVVCQNQELLGLCIAVNLSKPGTEALNELLLDQAEADTYTGKRPVLRIGQERSARNAQSRAVGQLSRGRKTEGVSARSGYPLSMPLGISIREDGLQQKVPAQHRLGPPLLFTDDLQQDVVGKVAPTLLVRYLHFRAGHYECSDIR